MSEISQNKKSNKILNGVVILTVANIIVKIIGLAYKIPLLRILGENGMAYYNSAYQIYTWFYTLSTAGLPLAVAKLVAWARAEGKFRQSEKTLKVALSVFGFIGIIGTAAMLTLAGPLSDLQSNPSARISIMMLAPTLFFICLTSALRGFFQGYQNMLPTAISEVIEAGSKLALGIALAMYARSLGLSIAYQAAYAILGVSIGAVLSTLYLYITKKCFKTGENKELDIGDDPSLRTKNISKSLLNIAIPISLSSSVMSIASLIDSFVMIGSLRSIGYEQSVAEGIFGNYTTQCVTMYNLPTVLVLPIAVGIVPFLTEKLQKNDKEGYRDLAISSMKMTNVIAFPCALGMAALANPILKMVFDNDTDTIAPMLSVLSLAIIFVGIVTVTNVILQTYNKQYLTLISIICGALFKYISARVLTGFGGEQTLGVLGTPTSTVICYFVAAAMNLFFVICCTRVVPKIGSVFVGPLASALICAVAAGACYRLISGAAGLTLSTLAAICVAVPVYLVSIFIFGVITREDVILLPKGNKIAALLTKLHLLKG